MTRHLSSDLSESFTLAAILTSLSYALAYWAGWIAAAGINWLEFFAVATSYACTWLCVRQRRINYPIGAVSSVAYAVLFYQSGLLGSAVLNAYLVFQLIYGWFRWRADSHARPVTRVQLRWWPMYLAVTLGFSGGAGLIWQLTGTPVVWTDVAILIGSVLAQFLLDNKKLENWAVWAIVNVLAIWTYFHASLPLAGLQYVFFLANTVIGFVVWRRTMARVVKAGPCLTLDLPDDHPSILRAGESWSDGQA